MTIDTLVNNICAMESKKIEVSRGNVKEVLSCLTALEAAYRVKDKVEVGEVFAALNRTVKSKMKKVKNV